MENPPNKVRIPLWHSLMYSTGIMLIVGGIPAAILTSFLLTVDTHPLSRSDAFHFGVCMVGAEGIIASILLIVAGWITKHRRGG
jgi:hypothetical protein